MDHMINNETRSSQLDPQDLQRKIMAICRESRRNYLAYIKLADDIKLWQELENTKHGKKIQSEVFKVISNISKDLKFKNIRAFKAPNNSVRTAVFEFLGTELSLIPGDGKGVKAFLMERTVKNHGEYGFPITGINSDNFHDHIDDCYSLPTMDQWLHAQRGGLEEDDSEYHKCYFDLKDRDLHSWNPMNSRQRSLILKGNRRQQLTLRQNPPTTIMNHGKPIMVAPAPPPVISLDDEAIGIYVRCTTKDNVIILAYDPMQELPTVEMQPIEHHLLEEAWNGYGLVDMIGNVWELCFDFLLAGGSFLTPHQVGHQKIIVPIAESPEQDELIGIRRIISLDH